MWIKACIISFVIAAVLEPVLIPILRKLKFGQTIYECAPETHQKKQGTPTMGGIAFIFSTVVASLIFAHDMKSGAILLCGVLFAAIGFVDDYIKVFNKRNMGFTAKQKFAVQMVVSLAYALFLYFVFGQTETKIPFTDISLNLGIFYIPFVMLVLLATSNSANLTDGVDGLATSVGSIISLFFALALSGVLATQGGSIIAGALTGGLLGFLIYNAHPAKVFMGDTGSMFIGGLISAVAISAGMELFLIISAIVFLLEALSVIIQVAVFKKTKKRFFKKAPLHHHFEECGWKETKVVAVFALVTLLLCVVSYLAL